MNSKFLSAVASVILLPSLSITLLASASRALEVAVPKPAVMVQSSEEKATEAQRLKQVVDEAYSKYKFSIKYPFVAHIGS